PPGAGKGTQASGIAEKYNIVHISTGDIFRENIKNGTELGKKAKEYMDGGNLVPDELTCNLVEDRVSKEDCKNGYLLDGFPRTQFQAEHFDSFLKSKGEGLDCVIDIQVPDEVLLPRAAGRRVCRACGQPYHVVNKPTKVEGVCDVCGGEVYQRADDAEETVKNRLKVYAEQTAVLTTYYTNTGILKSINGDQAMDKVFADICEALGE
ncbi:MAG: adenylate kinase, partial [Bacillota bacterium]|nr:adenylate kinase [Bacillota bacterium]